MPFPNLVDLWKEKIHPQTYGYIGAHTPLNPKKQAYLTVSLESVNIPYVRKGLDKFYGTLYGSISLSSDTATSFQSVTTLPTMSGIVELDSRHLDRVVQSTLCLLDDVPYRQEGLSVNLCLFSVQSANLAQPYIALLKSVADTAGIAFLSQAVPLADAIRTGITGLVGPNELEIGLCKEFPTVEDGYYAVIRTDEKTLPLTELSIDPTTHRLVQKNQVVTEFPYFVLRFQSSDTRENWKKIPEIQKAYDNLISHCSSLPPEYPLNQRAFAAFETAVKLSDELLAPDAKRLIQLVHDQVKDFLNKPKLKKKIESAPVEGTGNKDFMQNMGNIEKQNRRYLVTPTSLTGLVKDIPFLASETKTLSLDNIALFEEKPI